MKRRRWMAMPGALVAAALTLAACVTARVDLPGAPVPAGSRIAVQSAPVPLNPADPSQTAIGGFRYAGGVALTSNQTSRLHGLSDIVVEDLFVTAVSDDGDIVRFGLAVSQPGERLATATASNVFVKPITGLDGQPVQGKAWGDAEGLAILTNGDRLISFEQNHRIWRYVGDEARATQVNAPTVTMGDNDGMEGLAAAPAIAADAYWVGIETGAIWLCRLSVPCRQVGGLPSPPAGFRLSALTTGPAGELVILHHSYIPAIGSRIVVSIVRDPLGEPTMIGGFSMGPNSTTDNFEGVAVVKKPNGDWRFYLLSDDNFSASQRTLLLAFDWTPPQ